jgi:putative intracellular protease/amidase
MFSDINDFLAVRTLPLVLLELAYLCARSHIPRCKLGSSPTGKPIINGRKATSFVAIKDDVVNAGAIYVDVG